MREPPFGICEYAFNIRTLLRTLTGSFEFVTVVVGPIRSRKHFVLTTVLLHATDCCISLHFIPGVTISKQDLDNMLNALRERRIDILQGDDIRSECAWTQKEQRTRMENQGFQLDYWAYVTCTLKVHETGFDGPYLRLYLPDQYVGGTSLQTLFLPLYEHNTASFTTVPRTSIPSFFITASLTGCDVFVASAGSNVACPLVVIHTNYCGQMTTDVNQQEAMAVLELDLFMCHQQYQVQYRFASENHRAVIERGHYNYFTDYYDTTTSPATVFYGYTHGTSTTKTREPWYFCRVNRESTGKCDLQHPIY